MSRVKIEDLKPEAKELNAKEMKNLFGGAIIIDENPLTARTLCTSIQLSDVATKGGGGGGGCADQVPSPILINK